jgi:uncharacterized protein (TIGR02680 family)
MIASKEAKPALPLPHLHRWQPLRLGVVNLFHYDSEEFWFSDGHLLLRGNNGTGKSKVLSLTLPFLFDAYLKPSRIEPDGDANKKMSWNLLLGKHERRMGYAWVEFGRIDENGEVKYLTLGCGLLAVAARVQVDSWFFLLEGQRIGQDLWLISPQRVVLTKERLKEVLEGHGQVFPTHESYRRAIDGRLFQLGVMRYAALMDTLIQLRQPQLSKKPDETSLSNALTEALPPLSADLLTDVAEAMNQLEEDRRQLDEYERLADAVDQFNKRYRVYASVHSRRQARLLRSAQTGFDNASQDLNAAKASLEHARETEQASVARCDEAEFERQRRRARHEELLSDPTMKDANRVEHLAREVELRRRDLNKAERSLAEANGRLQQEIAATKAHRERGAKAEQELVKARTRHMESAQVAGITEHGAANVLTAGATQQLATLKDDALDAARNDLRRLADSRREQLALLRRRHAEVAQTQQLHDQQLSRLNEYRNEAEAAAIRREEADADVETQGGRLVVDWQKYVDGLRQLHISNASDVMNNLAAWVLNLDGENPAVSALLAAQQRATERLTASGSQLELARQELQQERQVLEGENERLQAGEDTQPPTPVYRSPAARAGCSGAPLWQLVEFTDALGEPQRAALEAALEASGLLDAWVTPDGKLHDAAGGEFMLQPLHDTQLLPRPPVAASLAAWLQPAGADVPVAAAVVAQLLAGVSCAAADDGVAEAWVSPDGRYRLGALAGSWSKPNAVFIGFAARTAARKRRLGEIARRMTELLIASERNHEQLEQNRLDTEQAIFEWKQTPSDSELRTAHAEAAASFRAFRLAIERADRTDKEYQEALKQLQGRRKLLAEDAADLHLPLALEDLVGIDVALLELNDRLHELMTVVRELRAAIPEHQRQQEREADARQKVDQGQQELDERFQQVNESQARLDLLRESVGAKVEDLQQKLKEARDLLQAAEACWTRANEDKITAGQERVRREEKADSLDMVLLEAITRRQNAVDNLQQFAKTELVAIALTDAELPDADAPWTIEPALTLARRIEQALSTVKDDDDSWHRIQKAISQDFTDLQRALGALHQQAQAETTEYGMIVLIIYENRSERPDRLGARLAAEITERRELLTAREREVLENHLQAEIAAAVQQLMRDAVRQVDAINKELEKRPTSTGVKFRLQWQPLAEGAEGAPVGLEVARKRLLNTSTDLWSAEDRRVVGAMLQQRIAAERERADAAGGGSILDQLIHALDYRRWHRFSVQRWQDGQWRKLSGPASSGERALGLTVPLFAAVASFYSQGGYLHAPRLVLLDEAFAGIDDDARAHCMGLIKEFDLDFVITSEREWGCYAALPGVSICQLQRREGIDAVHVSRWTWNGKTKHPEPDPDRRFTNV